MRTCFLCVTCGGAIHMLFMWVARRVSISAQFDPTVFLGMYLLL